MRTLCELDALVREIHLDPIVQHSDCSETKRHNGELTNVQKYKIEAAETESCSPHHHYHHDNNNNFCGATETLTVHHNTSKVID